MAQVLAPTTGRGTARIAAALLGLFALYIVGLDQGHLLSLAQGAIALDQNVIHEVLHDARHAAGFPCH
jgi:cobalt transporter subunit CbtB